MKIVYIHGWGSSPNGDSSILLGNAIRAVYGDDSYYALAYSQKDAYESFDDLRMQLDIIIDAYGNDGVIIVTSSLGGFWGLYFSRYYKVPCILINPSLKPWETLSRYGAMNLDNYKSFQVEVIRDEVQRVVILGINDDIVDPKFAMESFEGKATISKIVMGHRVTPVAVPFVLDAIYRISNR